MKYILIFALVLTSSFAIADQTKSHAGHSTSTSVGHDAHFLDMFSAHHKDGVKMAQMALEKSQTVEIKKMATKTVKDQTFEIQQMKMWRERYFFDVQSQEESPKKMDMSELEKASGKEFDVKFAKMMAHHHKVGIKMTQEMMPTLRNKEVKTFAQKSASKQTEEVKMLEKMADKLGSKS